MIDILLIEDDNLAAMVIKRALKASANVKHASNLNDAHAILKNFRPQMTLLDLNIHECLDGITMIPQLKETGSYIVVMSQHETECVIEECYEKGADSYYIKGDYDKTLHEIIDQYLLNNASLIPEKVFTEEFITQDTETKKSVQELIHHLRKGKNSLLLGPTGVGKTTLAYLAHNYSHVDGKFIALNCAALPKDLVESELFGHMRGAFTGATQGHVGKIQAADHGTLFLDEVGALPLETQAKLLKVIEEKSFYAVGSNQMIKVNFNLIAATNEDLFSLAAKGLFRMDLLQRLGGAVVDIKALQNRPKDIVPLLQFFLNSDRKFSFTKDAMKAIERHVWAGNVREVKRFADYCASNTQGRISLSFCQHFFDRATLHNNTLPQFEQHLRSAIDKGLDHYLEELKEQIILQWHQRSGGVVNQTLRDLKISARQFYKYQTKDERFIL